MEIQWRLNGENVAKSKINMLCFFLSSYVTMHHLSQLILSDYMLYESKNQVLSKNSPNLSINILTFQKDRVCSQDLAIRRMTNRVEAAGLKNQ